MKPKRQKAKAGGLYVKHSQQLSHEIMRKIFFYFNFFLYPRAGLPYSFGKELKELW